MVRRAVVVLLAVLTPALLRADAASDAARAELSRERRLLSVDAGKLADITRRLEASLSDLAGASRAVADAVTRAEAADEVIRREDALSVTEQEVRLLLDQRRMAADRVVERRRRIALLVGDASARRPDDALNGRWAVIVDPGGQRGVFRLSLQGTIVSGEYALEGGSTGSLRGTFVNDRVRLERVDSKQGFNAVFYARLSADGREMAGTWESTVLGNNEASAGAWRAVRDNEKEDTP